jgi:7,8-dihydropterin-6-yl-methyl-4-(beta-D-ribofuranosyl)aminobenzene 5'-phosphate synthase
LSIRITTLSENTARNGGFLAEWGLSLLVEVGQTTVLMDTGAGNSAVHNADLLGIDLNRIDAIVLSHGHYDHTGGLREVLRRMKKEVPIIAHPDIWTAKYSRGQGETARYIGVPFDRRELESLGAKFQLTAGPMPITEDITTTGEVPMATEYEEIDAGLFVRDEHNRWQPDPLADDLALVVTSEAGLVVILGCAHRGMINTLQHARKITGVEKIQAVIGGSHLVSGTEERLWLTIAALREMDVPKLALCHCTGSAATAVMATEFGDRYIFNPAGTILELP